MNFSTKETTKKNERKQDPWMSLNLLLIALYRRQMIGKQKKHDHTQRHSEQFLE